MPDLGYSFDKTSLVVRCPYCGDSNNPSHGHLTIDLEKNLYFCFRCHVGGVLDSGWLLEFLPEHYSLVSNPSSPYIENVTDMREYLISGRRTSLPKKSAKFRGNWYDYFSIYSASGERLGYHLRRSLPNKESHTSGKKGMTYSYAPYPLFSSDKFPVTIVEGPYDCIGPNDVCIFGRLSANFIEKHFKGHSIILRPDGDEWVSRDKLSWMLKQVNQLKKSNLVNLIGTQVIKDGLDIDEVTDYNRQVILETD